MSCVGEYHCYYSVGTVIRVSTVTTIITAATIVTRPTIVPYSN